jgi:1-acyl-sn-glycerol-3-phosphate acyltransferase
MSKRINYYWRVAATGTSFAFFGIGGLMLSVLAFPPLIVFSRGKRRQYARWIIHKSFRLFMWFMENSGLMRLEVIGGERLHKCRNSLVVANHPTLIDVVALVSLIPDASCIVKQSLWKNPFLKGVVRAAKYISNSEPDDLIKDCSKELNDGNALIIFPEGTRSKPGERLRFLRGTAHIALGINAPILPIFISCNPTTLTKNEKWYQIPHRRVNLRIEVLDPISATQWVNPHDEQTIAVRKLTRALETFFNEKLENHERTQT